VALTAIDATRETFALQLDLRRPRARIEFFNRIGRAHPFDRTALNAD
jgi:hypothetical protein